MSSTTVNRLVAACVFLCAVTVYMLTLSPTVVFWDVGEFIAAAKMLQVPHPPGSPLFLLLARIAMMIPFAADQAVRAHAVSALLSALAVMFTYLVIVHALKSFRGTPETVADMVIVYGAGAAGALSLAFGTTYWDNSIEAEVYGASMFFLTVILWLAMRWRDRAEEPGNEKYLLLIAYLIGLSLGVHLLALLAIFPVLMVVYFRVYAVNRRTAFWFVIAALGIFFVVYPGIVKILPGMMDGEWGGLKSSLIAWIPWAIIIAVCWGAYTSYRDRKKMVHLGLMAIALIVLGYTTYVSVLIRSNAHPPMNENNPANLARLTSYLGREQYGEAPLFWPRRYSHEAMHEPTWKNYSGDWDFLLRYQLNHMFLRYLAWNYVGAAGDTQDSGVSFRATFGIPFLVGLLGLFSQFRRDWKLALVFVSMFVIMGPILALYQNQQDPQPRERDYFYVGAYLVFSLWIAIGVASLYDAVRNFFTTDRLRVIGAVACSALFLAAIPGIMLRMNWFEHNRSGNYVAWDYSYDLLQTCDKDAILFTNGDNDTFPLWYLQDVEGIRRDVRIVCLSLANTNWYVEQLKAKPYYPEAPQVPISLSDEIIADIRPMIWSKRQVDLAVPADVLGRYGATDTTLARNEKITWVISPTMQVRSPRGAQGALRPQDIVVKNIIENNRWNLPVYFATTCSGDSKIGLDDYLWFEGLAWKLEPRHITREDPGIEPAALEANLLHEPEGFSRSPERGFKFRRIADPGVYLDENTSHLMINFRSAFLRLASYDVIIAREPEKAVATLDRMETLIPRSKVPLSMDLSTYVASLYHRAGRIDRFNALVNEVEPVALELIQTGKAPLASYDNPYRVLLEIYDIRKEYRKSVELLKSLQLKFPNDQGLKDRIASLDSLIAAGADSTGSAPH